MEQMEMVHVLDHPLLQHKLSILRDETTGVKDFREIVCEIATLMCYDATRNLPLQAVEVQTPVAKAVTYQLAGKKLAIVPVLRAGLGMVEGILTLIPSAKVGHIGLFRDPDTLEPLPMGRVGLVNLISPLMTATPTLSVMTDDLGYLTPGEDCGCGINSPYLTILGRVGMPEIQTCAVGAAELLGRGEGFS